VNFDITQAFHAHKVQDKYISIADKGIGLLVKEFADFPHLILTVEIQQIMRSSAGNADILAGVGIDKSKLLSGGEERTDGHKGSMIGTWLVFFI
jgi:hypothetical protein